MANPNAPATSAPVVRTEASRKSSIRDRRDGMGGARLKLEVFGTIPGYHMYWENDDDARIEQRIYEGFEFVKPSEIQMASWIVQDKDLADRVSKYVGKKADGSPLRAFLLKCTDELWDDIQAMGQEQAGQWDDAIMAGTVGGVDSRYDPKGAERKLKTNTQG